MLPEPLPEKLPDLSDLPREDDYPEPPSIPALHVNPGPILFDWERLRRAYADKDFPVSTYVKYGLELEYGAKASFVQFSAVDFAEQLSGDTETSWGQLKTIVVKESDVLKALAELSKRQALELDTTIQLTLHL